MYRMKSEALHMFCVSCISRITAVTSGPEYFQFCVCLVDSAFVTHLHSCVLNLSILRSQALICALGLLKQT